MPLFRLAVLFMLCAPALAFNLPPPRHTKLNPLHRAAPQIYSTDRVRWAASRAAPQYAHARPVAHPVTVRGGEQDAPRAGPAGVFDKAVALGAAKAGTPWRKLLPLGFASGVRIAFGAFLAVSVGGSVPGIKATDPGLQRILLGAFGLPMGLLMTVCAGGELVTGNFALCSAALAEGRTTRGALARNWAGAFLGNLAGSLILAKLAAVAFTGVAASSVAVATGKMSATLAQTFARAILCNILVCTAVWMAASQADFASKAMAVFFPISGFVALGLDHSVANMFLVPFGMLNGAEICALDFVTKNLIPVTLGNLVGGLFVGLVYQQVYSRKN